MNFFKLVIVTLSFITLGSSLSFATISSELSEHSNQFSPDSYIYETSGSGGKGDIKNTTVLYNNKTKNFQMNYDFDQDANIDLMWSVVSTGVVKGSEHHAIIYTDLNEDIISVYRYNTDLGVNSFKSGDLLATFRKDGTNMISDESFTINVGGINSAFGGDWEGIEMNEKGGIWFHSARDASIKYDANGQITRLDLSKESWVDKENFATTAVPAPLGIFAIAVAFGLVRLRYRQSLNV